MTTPRWALNGAGRLGRVEGYDGDRWHGTDMLGQPWKSMAPILLSIEHSRELDALLARGR